MYLKLIPLFIFAFTTFLAAEIKQEPEIEFTRISYEALKKDPNKEFVHFLKGYEGHPVILMHLKNFPRDKKIHLSAQRLLFSKEDCRLYEFVLEKSINDSMFLYTWCFLPGEYAKINFKSEDNEFKYSTTYIPNPIQLKNEEGRVLLSAELSLSTPKMDVYNITLNEAKAKEKLMIRSVSEDEVAEYPIEYMKGNAIRVVPGVCKKKGGISQFTVTRESGEKLSLNLPWGSELYKYKDGKEIFDVGN